jgi:hypothetical protein
MQPFDLTANQSLEENAPAQPQEGGSMEWNAIKDKNNPADWRVESIDFNDEGQVNVVVFSGPQAQTLANEYAQWKNSIEQRKPARRAVR